MKIPARSLVLAAVAASSLAASRARACDDDRRPAPPAAWQAPAPVGWDGGGDRWRDRDGDAHRWRDRDGDRWRDGDRDRWRDGDGDRWRDEGWRRDVWRHRALARVQAELFALDRDRADFMARWGWQPRKVARYDAWYAPRRAELERRRAELAGWVPAAWR